MVGTGNPKWFEERPTQRLTGEAWSARVGNQKLSEKSDDTLYLVRKLALTTRYRRDIDISG
ncbi:MAG: hypothetical protein KDA80_14295 [Planctomycetaceae bacterium]|nr:hypothetical protein [Planctomycetaceae bacterium]